VADGMWGCVLARSAGQWVFVAWVGASLNEKKRGGSVDGSTRAERSGGREEWSGVGVGKRSDATGRALCRCRCRCCCLLGCLPGAWGPSGRGARAAMMNGMEWTLLAWPGPAAVGSGRPRVGLSRRRSGTRGGCAQLLCLCRVQRQRVPSRFWSAKCQRLRP